MNFRTAPILARLLKVRADDRRIDYQMPIIGHISLFKSFETGLWYAISFGRRGFPEASEALVDAVQAYMYPATPPVCDRSYERMEARMTGPGTFEQD